MNKIWLWARYQRLPLMTSIALGSTLLIRVLVALLFEAGGTNIEIDPLWVSTAMTIPLLLCVSAEVPHLVCMPRGVRRRRAWLLSVILVIMLGWSWALYPTNLIDFGAIATARNCLGLLGIGLIFGPFTGRRWLWVPPTLTAMGSVMFSWPLHPTTAHTVYGFLRAPGVLRYGDGTWDLSIPLAVALFALGSSIYLCQEGYFLRHASPQAGTMLGRLRTSSDTSSVRSFQPSSLIRRGWARSDYQWILCCAGVVLVLWTSLAGIISWGVNVRIALLDLANSLFIIAPLVFMSTMIIGQARHRCGFQPWQACSERSTFELLRHPLRSAVWVTFLPWCSTAIAAALFSGIVAYQQGVSASVLLREVGHALPAFLEASAYLLGVAVLGVIGGHYIKTVIAVPLSAVVMLGVFIVATPNFDEMNVEHDYAATYGYTHCSSGTAPQVCTSEPNMPYLAVSADALHQVYADSPAPSLLPTTVYVVNNTLKFVPGNIAAIGVEPNRSWDASAAFDPQRVRQDLSTSLSKACPESQRDWVSYALGFRETLPNGTPPTPSLDSCLTPPTPAVAQPH